MTSGRNAFGITQYKVDWVENQLFIYLERLFVKLFCSPIFDGFLTIVIKPGNLSVFIIATHVFGMVFMAVLGCQ